MSKFLFGILLLVHFSVSGQVYQSEKSSVIFFSDAAIEDIKAENNKVESAIDVSSGVIEFRMAMKDFKFAKSLMRQHFNEKYVHSEKFPESTFVGKVTGLSATAGKQDVTANGKLTIHGITKTISVPGTIEIQNGKLRIQAKFMVRLEDYNIDRPQILWENIAEEVEVTLDITCKPE